MTTSGIEKYIIPFDADGNLTMNIAPGQERDVIVTPREASRLMVQLNRDSRLRLYIIGAEIESVKIDMVARLDADSHFNLFVASMNDRHSESRFELHLDAAGATANLDGLAFLTGGQTAGITTQVNHHAPHCTSNQSFKFLVGASARGQFDGLIRVDHGAHHTAAFQNNRNLLAHPSARMLTQPQLEIYCDDVKCSHGAATGQLDQQALFYMRSRGIDLPEARSMLMNAFVSDIIDRVHLEPLREKLRHYVENHLLTTP